MRMLASVRLRLFLVCYVIYSLFFATNVVREHYPAFALVEHGSLRCDDYEGFHADIFKHTDGHSYINSNVAASVLAAAPLLLADPALDALQAYSLRKVAEAGGEVDTSYDTKYPNRRAMFRKVKLAGLDLRFGASTVVTSVLLMAPLSALCVLLLFDYVRRRGVAERMALYLAFFFAFGTPVFYRSAHLNHNMLMMPTTFGAFLLLCGKPGRAFAPSARARFFAGLLTGLTVALDYSGFVIAAVLFVYFVGCRLADSDMRSTARDSLWLIAGGVPGLLLLLGSQWAEFGNPLTPAQFVMKAANYTDEGVRGIGAPSLEILLKNAFAPGWGMYTFAPVFLLALWPVSPDRSDDELILPRRERRLAAALVLLYVLFCGMNRYSLMQFNTGFRYLAPLMPIVFLQLSDHLVRFGPKLRMALLGLSTLHMTVMSMTREVNDTEKELADLAASLGVPETALPDYWYIMVTKTPIPMAYQRIWEEGVQLPWLTVIGQTMGGPLLRGPLAPSLLIGTVVLLCAALWVRGERMRAQSTR